MQDELVRSSVASRLEQKKLSFRRSKKKNFKAKMLVLGFNSNFFSEKNGCMPLGIPSYGSVFIETSR